MVTILSKAGGGDMVTRRRSALVAVAASSSAELQSGDASPQAVGIWVCDDRPRMCDGVMV